ncbi:PDZ domain-containing protein [Erysipelothrix sp. HDW6A]|uniref:S1C family serine protease n=1 Tax=Erysipelothrix sp. HDW6A TaxID=2714928 RepID=UPI00140A50F0|nr:trypsin-like peptidase domain-containing protein [Erysipelothrix sp. HDW6A]QIK56808.1 PDZ domain-containing protein [Erysipelothrix sp. HDW6A]
MKKQSRSVIIVILVALLVWSGVLTWQVYELNNSRVQPVSGSNNDVTVNKVVSEMDTDVTQVAEKVRDKVVSVINHRSNSSTSSGSGVVYKKKDGKILIISNHHVVDGAQSIKIRFASGEEVDGKVLGSDQFSDLALIEIDAELEVDPFDLGDSSLAKVGEFVIAVGSPMGIEFANSVTFGIVSGKDRTVPVDLDGNGTYDWDMVVLQTDAAISPGNSGGALVNMAGELIGINSMKLSNSDVEGMGFAIPISEVVPIVNQLEEYGKVEYPVIGISAVALSDVNPYYLRVYNIDKEVTQGVLVSEVTAEGPASKAGIKAGDVITKFGDAELSTFRDFRRQLYSHSIGDTVKLTINRSGEVLEVDVTLK